MGKKDSQSWDCESFLMVAEEGFAPPTPGLWEGDSNPEAPRTAITGWVFWQPPADGLPTEIVTKSLLLSPKKTCPNIASEAVYSSGRPSISVPQTDTKLIAPKKQVSFIILSNKCGAVQNSICDSFYSPLLFSWSASNSSIFLQYSFIWSRYASVLASFFPLW